MKTVTRDQWIKALKSGKYKKAKHKLRKPLFEGVKDNGIGYCCLGVICDLAGTKWKEDSYDHCGTPEIKELAAGKPGNKTSFLSGKIINVRRQQKLAALNDENETFDEVIAAIEKMWPKNVVIIDPSVVS